LGSRGGAKRKIIGLFSYTMMGMKRGSKGERRRDVFSGGSRRRGARWQLGLTWKRGGTKSSCYVSCITRGA